jgi:hypothetical protein
LHPERIVFNPEVIPRMSRKSDPDTPFLRAGLLTFLQAGAPILAPMLHAKLGLGANSKEYGTL